MNEQKNDNQYFVTNAVPLATLEWCNIGGWKRCRKCGAQAWQTNLGECRDCRGDKWLSTEGGERIRKEDTTIDVTNDEADAVLLGVAAMRMGLVNE